MVFLVAEATLYQAIQSAKRRYETKDKKYLKVSGCSFSFICSHFKILVMSFIPLFNIILLFIYLFKGIKIEEAAIKEVDKALEKRGKNANN